MSMAKDIGMTSLGLFLLTCMALLIPGILGGVLYLIERPEASKTVSEPLTQSDIDLMNRLRDEVNMEHVDSIDKNLLVPE
jgi:hypothetical protein